MGVTPARIVARKVLTDVRAHHAYIAQALSRVLTTRAQSARDIGYGTRLAHLSVGCYRAVSEILDEYLDDPAGLAPVARDCLVVSATELLYLDAPTYAVDQGVELMKTVFPSLGGVANAVLRKITESRKTILQTTLGREYGFPQWMAQQFVDEYGLETARQIMEASNTEPPLYACVLSVAPPCWKSQLEQTGARIEPVEGRSGTLQSIAIGNMHAVRAHPLVASRAILISDIAAQVAISLAPVADGTHVLDVCCGRGSKSLMWADLARRAGYRMRITAVDNVAYKIQRAQHDATVLGYDEITFRNADAASLPGADDISPKEHGFAFDTCEDAFYNAVFVDAPCSGLGTLRRHSDKRMTLESGDIVHLASLSLRILCNGARKVAKGGALLYSTCTISRRENERVIAEFLGTDSGREFVIDRIDDKELPLVMVGAVTREGFVQTLPRKGEGDGHFIARLRRR